MAAEPAAMQGDFSVPARDVFALRAQGGRVRLWAIDVTNRCDAACTYCPHSGHKRARGVITEETFVAALDVMTNDHVNLHFFTEPLLHPRLTDLVRIATERGVRVGFSTNGRLLTQDKLDGLAAAGLRWLRLHTSAHLRPGEPFGVRRSQFVVPEGLVFTEHRVGSAAGKLDDVWDKGETGMAGHRDFGERDGWKRCSFLGTDGRGGAPWRVLMWDGRFALCCVDIEGSNDPALCAKCRGFVFESPEVLGDYDGTGMDEAGGVVPAAQGVVK